jgi:TolB-like protein/DNA-binding winged helix-turn-helix (wHTH) protein
MTVGEDVSGVSLLRFGAFEVNLKTGELRKGGTLVGLPPQPFRILALLACHAGQLVTREEIQKQIWGNDTFVDFETGLNFAINKIRAVLGDDAEAPSYIETLPRRGYRFVAPVETVEPRSEELSLGSVRIPPEVGVKSGPAGPEAVTTGITPAPSVQPAVQEHFSAGLGVHDTPLSPFAEAQEAPLPKRLSLRLVGIATVLAFSIAIGWLVRYRLGPRSSQISPEQIQSLAVLPLENLSGNKEQEYFADGMTDALITDLGKVSALRVISRTSTMQYKGTKKNLPQIACELNVDAVVEGTVTHSGDRVRITAQLIEAKADKHLWAESYERDLKDVLALQDEVARAIAREIKITLTPQEQTRLSGRRTVNPEAYQSYLKGRFYWRKFTAADFAKSIDYYQQALDADPTYAPAYAGLADAYALGSLGGGGKAPKETIPKAREAAAKALELDNSLGEAHLSLALVRTYYDWDWSGADQEFKRAIELNPNYAEAHHFYSH